MISRSPFRVRLLHVLLLVAVALAILGAKFSFIERYGSDLPYWDQWDGEGETIYRPYLERRLETAAFFRPHNEHRIAPTLFLGLGLLELNDRQWDGRLQITVNAFLHVIAALLLVSWAWRWFSLRWVALFGGVVAVFFTPAIAWENALSGFQSQFYFLLLFSLLHIAGTFLARPRSWRWYLAPLGGLLAIFSMGSGLIAPLAIIAITGIRGVRERALSKDDRVVLAINGALAVVGWLARTHVAAHDFIQASSFRQWLEAWLHQLAWPMVTLNFPFFFWLGVVPSLGFLFAFWRRWVDGRAGAFLVCLSAWIVAQISAIAYARGGVGFGYSPRYNDLLGIGVLLNVLLLGALALRLTSPRLRWSALGFLGVFVATCLFGFRKETGQMYALYVNGIPAANAARLESVHLWVNHHDEQFFNREAWRELPFPDAHALANMLDTPAIESILPPSARRAPTFLAKPGAVTGFKTRVVGENVIPAPYDLKAWIGSEGKVGAFESTEFKTTHSTVSLFVLADQAAAPIEIALIDHANHRFAPLSGPLLLSPRWKRINFHAPPGYYRVEVKKPAAGTVSFTQPFTDTTLSRAVPKLLPTGSILEITGFSLLGIVLVISLFSPGETGSKSVAEEWAAPAESPVA